MKRKINWKLVFNILSLLVPIGLVIYFLTSEQGLIDLMENASKMNLWWTGAGVLCQFLNITVDAIVLYLIIHNYEKKYTFKQAIKATVIGQFYSVITPGAVGGQPMQLYCMSKQGVDGGVASSCLLQKFLVYQTTITFYSLVAMLCNMSLFYGDLKNLMLSLALFGFLSHLVVVIFMFIFSFNRKLASSIINFFFRLLTSRHDNCSGFCYNGFVVHASSRRFRCCRRKLLCVFQAVLHRKHHQVCNSHLEDYNLFHERYRFCSVCKCQQNFKKQRGEIKSVKPSHQPGYAGL